MNNPIMAPMNPAQIAPKRIPTDKNSAFLSRKHDIKDKSYFKYINSKGS